MGDTELECAQCKRKFPADYEGVKEGERWLCSKLCAERTRQAQAFAVATLPPQPDLTYAEARRQARTVVGTTADLEFHKGQLFPARVFVTTNVDNAWRKVTVGAGNTYREAIEDARKRQKLPEAPHPQTEKSNE